MRARFSQRIRITQNAFPSSLESCWGFRTPIPRWSILNTSCRGRVVNRLCFGFQWDCRSEEITRVHFIGNAVDRRMHARASTACALRSIAQKMPLIVSHLSANERGVKAGAASSSDSTRAAALAFVSFGSQNRCAPILSNGQNRNGQLFQSSSCCADPFLPRFFAAYLPEEARGMHTRFRYHFCKQGIQLSRCVRKSLY